MLLFATYSGEIQSLINQYEYQPIDKIKAKTSESKPVKVREHYWKDCTKRNEPRHVLHLFYLKGKCKFPRQISHQRENNLGI